MAEAPEDEAFESLCQLCRAQNVDFTSDLAIVARPRTPKLLVARRSQKARERSPEHLHLDRRQLGRCPVLEEEVMLRLVNYQNNAITRIEHLDRLPHLAFLDLYDNKIQSIENLDSCRNLRVLMLGKNQIQRIEKLDSLEKLDVLDLHSNRIKEIRSINHLKHLRVLNLAGNLLQQVSGLENLSSLTELNVRRNAISSTAGLEQVPQIQRVFASHNHIMTHEGLRALGSINNLRELSLDGNPVVEAAEAQVYRAHILSLCPALETLDNVKAEVQRGMSKRAPGKDAKEENKETKAPAVQAAQDAQAAQAVQAKSFVIPSAEAPPQESRAAPARPKGLQPSPARTMHSSWLAESLNISPLGPNALNKSAETVKAEPKAALTSEEVLAAIKTQWQDVLQGRSLMTRHGYVKREHAKELSIFGRGLDALDKAEYQNTVTSIHFHYIHINVLANETVRMAKFKDLSSITLVHNQMRAPKEVEAFRKLTRLKDLAIQDNPVCKGRANLRVQLMRCLPQLRSIDGQLVSDLERVESSHLRAWSAPPSKPEAPGVEDVVQSLMTQACDHAHCSSMVQLHFEDAVRNAIREAWVDLNTGRARAVPMPVPSSGFTMDEQ